MYLTLLVQLKHMSVLLLAYGWPAGAHPWLTIGPELQFDNTALGCLDISLTLLSCLPRQGFQANEAGVWSLWPSPAELQQH